MNPIAQLCIAALFAVAGYQRAVWFGRRYGRTPWGWPPIVWAVVFGVSLLLGVLLLVIAERVGRRAGFQALAPVPADPYGYPSPAPGRFGCPQPQVGPGEPESGGYREQPPGGVGYGGM